MPFNVANPAAFDQLKLRMKYDDAFVAYLNGTEVARRNFAGTPRWNSVAGSPRTGIELLTYEDIDISAFLSSLVAGPNVLAIQGINVAAGDSDALVLPELIATDIQTSGLAYFTTPTPGAANGAGVVGFVESPHVQRRPRVLQRAVPVDDQHDHAEARRFTTRPTATRRRRPRARCTRARSPSTRRPSCGRRRSARVTSSRRRSAQTYLFLNDVVRQTPTTTRGRRASPRHGAASRPTTAWTRTSSATSTPTAIPPAATCSAAVYAATIKNDLMSIPTMSIVMDVDDMFGTNGINTNSTSNAALRGSGRHRSNGSPPTARRSFRSTPASASRAGRFAATG